MIRLRIRRALINFGAAVLAKLPKLSVSAWLTFVVPFALATSFIISTGPYFQQAILSSVSNKSANIYAAVNGNAIALSASLSDWLQGGFYWPYLICAGAVSFISIYAGIVKRWLFLIFISAFVSLNIMDALSSLLPNPPDVEFSMNVICNLVGSILISFLAGANFWLYRLVRLHSSSVKIISQFAGAASLIAFGVLISAGCYLGYEQFFANLPIQFEFLAKAPVSGWIVEPTNGKPFNSLIPGVKFDGYSRTSSTKGGIAGSWTRAAASRDYRLEATLFLDCAQDELLKLPAGRPGFVTDNVKSFRFDIDSGTTEIVAKPEGLSKFNLKAEKAASYTLNQEEGGSLGIIHFSGDSSEYVVAGNDKLQLWAQVSLFGPKNKSFTVVPRDISFTSNSRTTKFRFHRTGKWNGSAPLRCRRGDDEDLFNASNKNEYVNIYVPDAILVTIMFNLIPDNTIPVMYSEPEYNLKYSGFDGWTEVYIKKPQNLQNDGEKPIGTVSATGNINNLYLDDIQLQVTPADTLFFIGDSNAQLLKTGELHVAGKAKAAWKNNSRLNKTKWEKLPTEWQLAIGGVLATLLSWIAAVVWFQRAKILLFLNANPKQIFQ
ncbi:hypothetical protein AEAC466_19105 [Asticcacaulis sp. AC466]|uniref:hypothetical protein n=1 Tax=Asticcacaulis sp. AC466 TaxID=1282362 RepID=UPI0003C3BA61|nr:hypothetical protein [Asticcacaulis sp. AC466]ESQ82028.1 hypothetical protein AEAC466_19105 [Asticcacaulis sp. AC466]